MNNPNTSENFFYDSDEDVAWGPRSFREVKRDLKRQKKVPLNYRRQTASFTLCPVENTPLMNTITNSTNSSKDYFTANESMESNNLQSTKEIREINANSVSTTSINDNSTDKFMWIQNKTGASECPDIVTISSDSEDDGNGDPEFCHVKSERFSRSLSTKYHSFSTKEEMLDDIISLSSSEESYKDENESHIKTQDILGDSFENGETPKIQTVESTPLNKVIYSPNQSYINQCSSLFSVQEETESVNIPGIQLIPETPVKETTDLFNSSLTDGEQNSSFKVTEVDISKNNFKTSKKQFNCSMNQSNSSVAKSQHTNRTVTEEEDISNNELGPYTPDKQLNYSSDNLYYRDHFVGHENKEVETPKTKFHTPKINIISNTPIKGPNIISMNNSADQGCNSVQDYQNSNWVDLSNQSEDCIEIENERHEYRNSFESPARNIQETSINEPVPISLNTSLYESANISQNENEYDYCEEINHTLSSKLESDLSLKNSNKMRDTSCADSATSNKLDLSGINDISSNSFNYTKKDPSSLSKTRNDTATSNQLNTQNDSMTSNIEPDSLSEGHEISCMNDTVSEMQKLLTKGFDSDSDDSTEEIIDSTSCKSSRPAFGDSSIQNISRIPIPKSFSDDSKSNSSMTNEFKIPKFPTKVIKKTPVANKLMINKTSPLPLTDIISPVRLYINNSPYAPLKRTIKPCTKSLYTQGGVSESTTYTPKKHRNLLDSLPEVVYKPSRLVEEKFDDHIILPKNIKKLITERVVIKHEARKRINPNESMYNVKDKLEMGDLSVIVNDDQNMSVHTTKQGFNL